MSDVCQSTLPNSPQLHCCSSPNVSTPASPKSSRKALTLGDEGACALAALIAGGAKFSSLQLSANDINDGGMVALAKAISKARCLEKLSIYHNSIGARGCQALTAAVLATPVLKVVEFLPGNSAPTKDVKALARAVKANRSTLYRAGTKLSLEVI
ncbi:hypothetical protein COO60DRAFT_1626012 [Scenedesmus sp. NREL 46B-D3]|nr:hypothetical protein COO60DRAFT_1626012 [Scenedesmus sp. NREL 46B-D3]